MIQCDTNIFSKVCTGNSYWHTTDTTQPKKIRVPAFFAKIWGSTEESTRLLSNHRGSAAHKFFLLKLADNLASKISHELTGEKVTEILPLPVPATSMDKLADSKFPSIAEVVLGVLTVALIVFGIKNSQRIPTELQLTKLDLLPPQITPTLTCNNTLYSPLLTQDLSRMFEKQPLNETITSKEAVQEAGFPLVPPEGKVYEGGFTNGKRNGKGKLTWSDGRVYEGDFVDGKRTGKGKLTWSDSGGVYCGVYEGDFVDDRRTGKGKYTWLMASIYMVVDKDTGIHTWPDDRMYEGDFVDGAMTGKGKYTWPDGTVEEGDFINGQKI